MRRILTRIVPGVALGVSGLAGFLLATGALAPVIGALTPSPKAPAEQVEPVAAWTSQGTTSDWSDDGWMDDDSRPEWSSARSVPGASRPASPSLPSRPSIGVPENPKRFLRGGGPPPVAAIKLAARKSCFQQRNPGSTVKSFTVTPTKGGASVSWWDIGDPDTKSYQLTAVPTGGGSSTAVSRAVAAPGGCTTVNTSMSGLTSGQTYQFWLTALNTSAVNGKQYRPTVGQSNSIVVL